MRVIRKKPTRNNGMREVERKEMNNNKKKIKKQKKVFSFVCFSIFLYRYDVEYTEKMMK